MSNRTQILCNKNNQKIIQIIKDLRRDIRSCSIQLLKSKVEEKELINNILRLREQNQNANILLVKLGRLQYLIKDLEKDINTGREYIRYCFTNLVIC